MGNLDGIIPSPAKTNQPLARVGCTERCSFNPVNLPAGVGELIHEWFETGYSLAKVQKESQARWQIHFSNGSISRHKSKHLHPVAVDGELGEKMEDLQVLDTIIQRGAQQVKLSGTRVTTEQLLKAMELRLKLTQGSVFDHMFEAMKGAPKDLDAEFEDEASTRPDAQPDMGADEKSQGADADD